MALYHLHVKNISRGDGRSAVAAAAYRVGETLENAAEERLSKFAGRRDVLGAEIHLPADAPAWMADRAVLWNAVEAIERRKDARLAKEVEFSLPRELPREAWFAVARSMAAHFTAQGFVVDLAVHDDGTGHNPHVHLLLATRLVTPDGFGPKLRAADRKTFLKETRTAWQAIANAALEKAGIPVKIDAGSYAARGIDREPGEHHPPDPAARRRRREEVASMVKDRDLLKRVIDELAADPTAKERYPHLSQQPDWPPRERQKGATLALSPKAREEKAFWNEVDRRVETSALSNDRSPETVDRDVARDEERSIDDEVNSLAARVQAASLKEGEERRQAFAEGARDYAKLHRSVTRRMVAAGVLRPENVRSWDVVSRAFRDPEFDDRLAEARRLEAKRQEPDRTLRATPAQVAAVAKHDRAQAEREGFTFVPSPNPTRDAAQSRMLEEYEREAPAPLSPPVAASTREGPPDPFAYLATQQPARTGFEAAENRMVEEYQRDDRTPPDPYAWLRQQSPVQPMPKQDAEDRTHEHDRERER